MPPGIGYKKRIDPRIAELLGQMGSPAGDPLALLDSFAMPNRQPTQAPPPPEFSRGDLTPAFSSAPARGDMLTPEPPEEALSFGEQVVRNTPAGLIRSSVEGGKSLIDMLTSSNIPRGTTTGQEAAKIAPIIAQDPIAAGSAMLPTKEDFRTEGLGAVAGLEDLIPGGAIAKLLGGIGAATMLPGKIKRMNVGPLRDAQKTIASRNVEFPDGDLGATPEMLPALTEVPGMAPGARISTRLPTASREKNPDMEDGIADNSLRIDMETMGRSTNKNLIPAFAGYRRNHPDYLPGPDDSDAAVLQGLKDMSVDNLLWLYDQIPEDIRARSKKWYDGANRVAGEFGQQFGVTREAAAGVLASQSPQRDWFQNISLAERIMDVHQNKGQHVWDEAMTATAARIYKKKKFQDQLARVAGAKYDDLVEPVDKAMWLRAYSEAHHDKGFNIYSPEGDKMGKQMTGKGKEHSIAWGSLGEIASGIKVLEAPLDNQIAAIAQEMGEAHKVRNFYNNIIDPNSMAGDVTMDTHAIAAAHLRPLAGSDLEVDHNLGAGGSDSRLGIRGNYGVYADAYREAAAARGVLPREMQSITWEAIRSLYSPEFKRSAAASHGASLQKKVADGLARKHFALRKDGTPKMTAEQAARLWEGSLEQLWREGYQTGKLTMDQMREEILKRAGGFDPPDWLQ